MQAPKLTRADIIKTDSFYDKPANIRDGTEKGMKWALKANQL